MSGFKHTKGPWSLQKRAFVGRIHPANDPSQSIATVWRHKCANKIKYYHDDEQSNANGSLIAAAPEMLNVLIELYIEHAAPECGSCIPDGSGRDSCSGMRNCCYENARIIIERTTGLTIDEAIKAWEAER